MKAKAITETEIAEYKIASLPTRPTAPTEYGGRGYTSVQMKEAFDALPLYVISRFNELMDDITADSTDGIIHEIKLGFGDGMTLYELVDRMLNGNLLALVSMGDGSLDEYLAKLRTDVDRCMTELGIGDGDGNG